MRQEPLVTASKRGLLTTWCLEIVAALRVVDPLLQHLLLPLTRLNQLYIWGLFATYATTPFTVSATSVWIVEVTSGYLMRSYLILIFADYDLCSGCIAVGGASRHNPFHAFFEIHEPGRVVVHTVVDEHERQAANSTVRDQSPTSSPVVHSANCDLCDSRIEGDRYVSKSYCPFSLH